MSSLGRLLSSPLLSCLAAAKPEVCVKAKSSSGALRFPHVKSASLPSTKKKTNTHARNTKKNHTHKTAQTVVLAVGGAAVFPSFHPRSLSLSPSLLLFFSLPSLGFPPLVWCRSVCYRKETVLLLFPSSLGGVVPLLLPLPSALSPFERHRATQPCSPREHAECRSAPIRFPHAGQCMCACAR